MDQTEPERLCPHMTAGVCSVCEELDRVKEEVKRITRERDEARALARAFHGGMISHAKEHREEPVISEELLISLRRRYPWLVDP